MRGIPEETLEAAVIDGANPFQIFWKIMVPQIWGTIAVVWTTITILVLKVFDIVLTMTNGQWNSQVLANLMFDWMFRGGGDFGRGATIAIIIMIAVIPIMIYNIRQAQAKRREGTEMAGATGKSLVGRFGVHVAVLVFVAIWTIPTLGILVSSLRDKDQIIASGWWSSFSSSTQTEAGRLPAASAQVEKDGKFVIEGNIFGDGPAARHQRLRRQVGQPDANLRPARRPTSATASPCRSTPTAASS